jgi:hypothetical protein
MREYLESLQLGKTEPPRIEGRYHFAAWLALHTFIALYLVEAMVPLLMKATGSAVPVGWWPGETNLTRVVLFRCINTAACAYLIGLVVSIITRSSAALWVWVPTILWFIVGMIRFAIGPSESVVIPEGIWQHFFSVGSEQSSGYRWIRDFSTYTLPMISGVAYSIGSFCLRFFAKIAISSKSDNSL